MTKIEKSCKIEGKYNTLKHVFDKIPSLICVIDEKQNLEISNKAFKSFFGIHSLKNTSIGTAIGCKEAITKDHQCGFNEACIHCHIKKSLTKLISTKSNSVEQTIRKSIYGKNRKNQEQKCLKITVSTLDGETKPMFIVCFEDLTEIENINQEKNFFIGIAAHDLRNPLAIIKGMSDLLVLDKNTKPQNVQMLKRIVQNADYMIHLVNNLLDISHIESGLLTLDKTICNYSKFLKRTIDDNTIIAKSRKLKLKFIDNTNKTNAITCDQTYIEQVINNLIGNAMKFSDKGQHIEITLEEDAKNVITTIKDHGPGIKKSDQKRMFGVFQKTDNKPKSEEKSTGLGLAIVKKIIKAHSGKVSLDSKKGKYTAFSFTLPK